MSQYRRRPQPLDIVEAEQVLLGATTLWMVTLADGSRRIYADEEFYQLYERVGIMAGLDLEGDAR